MGALASSSGTCRSSKARHSRWRGDRMKCGSSVLLAALLVAASAFAQTAPRVPHIGWLAWARCGTASFENGLRDFGHVPGTSVIIECRSAGSRYELLPMAAQALVQLG